jgi:hypothetical protein
MHDSMANARIIATVLVVGIFMVCPLSIGLPSKQRIEPLLRRVDSGALQ